MSKIIPWYLLPYECIQTIFDHLPTIDLIKCDILMSLYSSDILIQQVLNNIWTKRNNILLTLYQLKNKKLPDRLYSRHIYNDICQGFYVHRYPIYEEGDINVKEFDKLDDNLQMKLLKHSMFNGDDTVFNNITEKYPHLLSQMEHFDRFTCRNMTPNMFLQIGNRVFSNLDESLKNGYMERYFFQNRYPEVLEELKNWLLSKEYDPTEIVQKIVNDTISDAISIQALQFFNVTIPEHRRTDYWELFIYDFFESVFNEGQLNVFFEDCRQLNEIIPIQNIQHEECPLICHIVMYELGLPLPTDPNEFNKRFKEIPRKARLSLRDTHCFREYFLFNSKYFKRYTNALYLSIRPSYSFHRLIPSF